MATPFPTDILRHLDPKSGLPRLEACLALLRGAPAGGQKAFEACALAAALLIRLGHPPARAIKFASKDTGARQLVQECTRELEYEGRVRELQALLLPSGPTAGLPPPEEEGHHPHDYESMAAVTDLLALLRVEDDSEDAGGQHDIEDVMSQLSKVLLAFVTLGLQAVSGPSTDAVCSETGFVFLKGK